MMRSTHHTTYPPDFEDRFQNLLVSSFIYACFHDVSVRTARSVLVVAGTARGITKNMCESLRDRIRPCILSCTGAW